MSEDFSPLENEIVDLTRDIDDRHCDGAHVIEQGTPLSIWILLDGFVSIFGKRGTITGIFLKLLDEMTLLCA